MTLLRCKSQDKLRLISCATKEEKVHFDEVDPAVTWSMGTGADFNLPGNIILGLGVLYSNDLPRVPDNHYELFRAIELGQMQNIAFGVGLSVPLGSVVELSLSGMMPKYILIQVY